MDEALTLIQKQAEKYREAKPEVAMRLVHESNKSIGHLKTQQDLMIDSVLSLQRIVIKEEVFDG